MSEAQTLQRQILTNEAKIKALQAYGDAFEKSLVTLAGNLAKDGYSKDEIIEAVHSTLPTLKAGMAQVQVDVERAVAEAFDKGANDNG